MGCAEEAGDDDQGWSRVWEAEVGGPAQGLHPRRVAAGGGDLEGPHLLGVTSASGWAGQDGGARGEGAHQARVDGGDPGVGGGLALCPPGNPR